MRPERSPRHRVKCFAKVNKRDAQRHPHLRAARAWLSWLIARGREELNSLLTCLRGLLLLPASPLPCLRGLLLLPASLLAQSLARGAHAGGTWSLNCSRSTSMETCTSRDRFDGGQGGG